MEWPNFLHSVNDDYLIGLTNKGIVKRAYKDLENATCSMNQEEDNLLVKVEDVTCTLRSPLLDSKCSCPSRSICKHIVMAILYAKTQTFSLEQSGEKEEQEMFTSVIEYPLKKLKSILGMKKYQEIFYKIKQGIQPQITVSSVVTVYFKESQITVSLLEPVENSSCTCHKKEICKHKAEAILFFQAYMGVIGEQDFLLTIKGESEIELENAKEFAQVLKAFLEEQFITGIARNSPTVMDSIERFAVIAHNQKLPDFERDLRKIKEEYELYFNRFASFETKTLLHEIASLYNKSDALLQVYDYSEFSKLAGEFRTDYLPCETLTLLGMGHRYFHSKTGYEGETYYFLCEETRSWYTYTEARPIFYETTRKTMFTSQKEAPWQLPCKLEDIADAKLRLVNGRASLEYRLSSTSETHAEYMGKRVLEVEALHPHYYEDFLCLYEERIAPLWEVEGKTLENLVIIKPHSVKEGMFDSIKQLFLMEMYDIEHRKVTLQVAYSKIEHYTIRFLERLAKQLQMSEKEIPCFFGILYIEDDSMKLYPINYYMPTEFL